MINSARPRLHGNSMTFKCTVFMLLSFTLEPDFLEVSLVNLSVNPPQKALRLVAKVLNNA